LEREQWEAKKKQKNKIEGKVIPVARAVFEVTVRI
jgi:hypothetical protein